jgi:hypothetical protein
MINIGQKSLPSVMTHSFSRVPQVRTPRSQFIRKYSNTTTFNADYIVPFFNEEVVPGDTVAYQGSAIIRLATPEVPFMDNLYAMYEFFFVPTRIIHDNWVKLMGEQNDPGDSIDYATPKMTSPATTGYVPPADWSSPTNAELAAALMDYLGIPTGIGGLEHHNYLGRAYQNIYNEWYRDQNLQDSTTVNRNEGPDTVNSYRLSIRS